MATLDMARDVSYDAGMDQAEPQKIAPGEMEKIRRLNAGKPVDLLRDEQVDEALRDWDNAPEGDAAA